MILSRRTLLARGGALLFVASVRRVALARAASRTGPDLFRLEGDTAGIGYGTFARHRAIRTAGGMDFDITKDRRVYPVAAGVVTAVRNDLVSGRFVTVHHGFYSTLYAHLAEELARPGQRVTRKDQLGVAGQSGYGAGLGPHLHLGLFGGDIVRLTGAAHDAPTYHGQVWLDPAAFAAYPATDSRGNATLPYWQGPDVDGSLDIRYEAHYEATRRFVDGVLAGLSGGERDRLGEEGLATSGDAAGVDNEFARALRVLYERSQRGDLPDGIDPEMVAERVRQFLSVRISITAPLRNPAPGYDEYYQ